jgi:hypothetical protein
MQAIVARYGSLDRDAFPPQNGHGKSFGIFLALMVISFLGSYPLVNITLS